VSGVLFVVRKAKINYFLVLLSLVQTQVGETDYIANGSSGTTSPNQFKRRIFVLDG
jgi:hypothetical protein